MNHLNATADLVQSSVAGCATTSGIRDFYYQIRYSLKSLKFGEIQRIQKIAKGSHFKVTLNGKRTIFPDHGGKEIGNGLVGKIKKDLGLK